MRPHSALCRKITDCGYVHGIAVALRLDDNFAAEDRSVVEGDAVDAAVARGPCLFGVEAHSGERILYQGFELGRAEFEQVWPLVEVGQNVGLLDEALVDHVELEDRPDRSEFVRPLGY